MLNDRNAWSVSLGRHLYIRKQVGMMLGGFDLHLVRHGIADEVLGLDLLMRALRVGKRSWYDPSLLLFHGARADRIIAWTLRLLLAVRRGLSPASASHRTNYPAAFSADAAGEFDRRPHGR
jgi:hypothetical protein